MDDCHCARASARAQFQNSLFEVIGVLSIRLAFRRFQLWNVATVAVVLNELLDSTLTNLELFGDQPSIHAMINNLLIYPCNILLVELHYRWSIIVEIMPTKSLADTTQSVGS
jgi:hypothetical protein